MKNTIVVINHVQDAYLDRNNPVDAALRQKIFDFVEEIRPFVKGIAWSYAHGDNARHVPFDMERERSPAFRDGDIVLRNDEGKGMDNNFMKNLERANPGSVVLCGVYYDACSKGTASTIKQLLGIPVAVPKDLADAPGKGDEYFHEIAAQDMAQIGINIKALAADLVAQAKEAPYKPEINLSAMAVPEQQNAAPAQAASAQKFTIRPVRDGDESHVCRLLGGDTSKIGFDDPRHPVNETVRMIEASRNPASAGAGFMALVDGKPAGVISTANLGGGMGVDPKFKGLGIEEGLAAARDSFTASRTPAVTADKPKVAAQGLKQ